MTTRLASADGRAVLWEELLGEMQGRGIVPNVISALALMT